MAQLLATIAPTVTRLRRQFELQFERLPETESGVRRATWVEMQSHFRRLTGMLHRQLRQTAANEGAVLTSGSLAERFVWTLLASCGTELTALAFGHRNDNYYRFVARSVVTALQAEGG
jgi:hypothetical protein